MLVLFVTPFYVYYSSLVYKYTSHRLALAALLASPVALLSELLHRKNELAVVDFTYTLAFLSSSDLFALWKKYLST